MSNKFARQLLTSTKVEIYSEPIRRSEDVLTASYVLFTLQEGKVAIRCDESEENNYLLTTLDEINLTNYPFDKKTLSIATVEEIRLRYVWRTNNDYGELEEMKMRFNHGDELHAEASSRWPTLIEVKHYE